MVGWLELPLTMYCATARKPATKIQCLAAGGQLSKDGDRDRRGRGEGRRERETQTGFLLVELEEENVEAPDFEKICRVERNHRKRVCNIGCRGDHVSL